jgi:hypothetical protein
MVNKRPVRPGYVGLRLVAEKGESVSPDRLGRAMYFGTRTSNSARGHRDRMAAHLT